MTSPQERREALFGCYWRGTADDATDKASALVESWLAEQAAEIERLSTSDWNGWADAINRARADERRRTAEEIKERLGALFQDRLGVRSTVMSLILDVLDEVGGSDEQQ